MSRRAVALTALALLSASAPGCFWGAGYAGYWASKQGKNDTVPNRPPELTDLGGGEFVRTRGVGGNVIVVFDLADPDADPVDVVATFASPDLAGGAPQPITALVESNLDALATLPLGQPSRYSVAWDSAAEPGAASANLTQVVVTLTPVDAQGLAGQARQSTPFDLTNNDQALAVVLEPGFNPDDSGRMVLEVRLFDAEADPVDLAVQWSDDGVFPSLDDADPQLLTLAPVGRTGRTEAPLSPYPADELFAPQLVAKEPRRADGTHALEGKTVELFERPGLAAPTPTTGLLLPVSAAPLGAGELLVCDATAGAVARLDLTSGAATPVATGVAQPAYAAVAPDGETVFVSDPSAGVVYRASLSAPGAAVSVVSGLNAPTGVAAVTSQRLLVSEAGSGNLLHVDLDSANVTTLTGGLADPRGVTFDRDRRTAYVVEAGSLTLYELESGDRRRVDAPANGLTLTLPNGRVGYLTTTGGELFELHRSTARFGLRADGLSGLLAAVPDPAGDGLLALVGASLQRYALGTRVVASATIETVLHATGSCKLDRALPALPPGTRFRVRAVDSPTLAGLATSPSGVLHRLVFDVSAVTRTDLPLSRVSFRATPLDPNNAAIRGLPGTTSFPKPFEGEVHAPLTLAFPGDTPVTGAVAEDLDGDGDVDVVAASGAANALAVFLRGADGFAAPTVHSGTDVLQVQSWDADGDGDRDLVALAFDEVEVFEQTAPGTFSGPTVASALGATTGTHQRCIADLDRDGNLDVVFTQHGYAHSGSRVKVARGLGGGAFSTVEYPAIWSPEAVTVGDLDGDGRLDLVVGSEYPFDATRVTVFLQPPGGFAGDSSGGDAYVRLPGFGRLDAIQLTDLDGDGDLDVLAVDGESSQIARLTHEGSLRFLVATAAFPADGTTVLGIGDWEGDGDRDLLVGTRQGGTGGGGLRRFEADAGGLTFVGTLDGGAATSAPETLLLVDVDGDGDGDPIVANNGGPIGDNAVGVFRQTPRAEHRLAELSAPAAETVLSAAAGDLDGDGDVDLVYYSAQTSAIGIVAQVSAGVFGESATIPLPNPGNDVPLKLEVVDLNSDGALDLALVTGVPTAYCGPPCGGPNAVTLAYLDGAGGVAGTAGSGTLSYGRSLVARDLNGDGAIDLAAIGYYDGVILLQAPGGAPPVEVPLPGVGGEQLAAGDFDDDGFTDLAAATVGASSITLVWSDGTPASITSEAVALSAPTTSAIAAGDLDRDGDDDIVVALTTPGQVEIHWQDPARSPSVVTLPGLDLISRLVVADVDQDGADDIVAGGYVPLGGGSGSAAIVIAYQTAPGVFLPLETLTRGTAPGLGIIALDVLDIDGDGRTDVSAGVLEVTQPIYFGR